MWRELSEYFAGRFASRPPPEIPTLMDAIAGACVGGSLLPLTDRIALAMQVTVAGLDTVASQLTFFAHFLAEHPEHREELIRNPALATAAVEELVRRYAVPSISRKVGFDADFHGISFRAGDMVHFLAEAAGLDDRAVDNPQMVDFKRTRSPHAGFGVGAHTCAGMFLARAELRIFIEEWLRRLPNFAVKRSTTLRRRGGFGIAN